MNNLYAEHRRQNLADQERHEARVRREIAEAEAERASVHPVRCGNVRAHGRGSEVYHDGAAGVRACYEAKPGAALDQVTREGAPLVPASQVQRQAEETMAARATVNSLAGPMTFAEFCESNEWWDGEYSPAQQQAAYQAYLGRFPSISTEQAIAQMRANQEAAERARQEAVRQRYAAWATIPVFGAHNRGYYALVLDGETHFFRVERRTEGRWAGKTFASEQASDTFHRMAFERQGMVLDAIAADPEAAGALYGQEIGKCYRCHRTLTDPESRALGIGPDCRKKG